MSEQRLLEAVSAYAAEFLPSLANRAVGPTATYEELMRAFGGPLPAAGADELEVIASLIREGESGVNAMPSGRFFGFVLGGAQPAALAADWLTSLWDQNACLYAPAPTAAVVEEVAAEWLRDLLGLPAGVSCGFVTGCQLAHVTCLAAARHHVLAQAGWDVEEAGIAGAPEIRVLVGDEVHVTVPRALRLLGIGRRSLVVVPSDEQGRMRADGILRALESGNGPTIVCVQVGNVNTGAADPVDEIVDAAHAAGAWVHVDGAFGLWAAAAESHRHLVDGVDRADSWATDGHKWLNVPYDCGYAFCAHPDAHRAAMTLSSAAAYLIHSTEADAPREPIDWNPEFSRRARGFPTYAALKALGRNGVSDLVERCCSHAQLFAELLSAVEGVEILNDVVLNQVLVRFADDDEATRETVRRVQEDGTCWLSGTTWQGRAAMRISVSNWRTTREDVERSAEAILRCARVAVPT
jgi:glutamate/tyrosine decarboxylase-like PLP-dependent enzyme